MRSKIYITLENGMTFEGYSFGAKHEVAGELVFTTAMTGYVETLTDPSFYGQIVVQTFPMAGDYGVNLSDMESSKCWVSAFIVREFCQFPSNFRCQTSLDNFLKDNNVVGVYGIDTRQLTKVIRESGSMMARITTKPGSVINEIVESNSNPVEQVTCKQISYYGDPQGKRVVVWDFGCKESIIKELCNRGVYCIRVPSFFTAEEILELNADGLLLSNGPGDPRNNKLIIENIKKLVGKLPIFAICLGHQLLALAMGGISKKMSYGHRGENQPVKDMKTGRVYISSQNHGYEVIASSLNDIAEVMFTNVNDDTCEGLYYPNYNAFTVQFHPEACGGPKDTVYLFDKFIANIEEG